MKLLGRTYLGLLAAAMCLAVSSVSRAADDGSVSCVSVTVDMATVVNTMRGGIGASWHAIEQPIPYSDKPHPVFGNKSHGGAAGGPIHQRKMTRPGSRSTATPVGWGSTGTGWNWSSGSTSPSTGTSVGTTQRCASCTGFSTGARRTRPTCSYSKCGETCVGTHFPSGATTRPVASTAARCRWRILARGWRHSSSTWSRRKAIPAFVGYASTTSPTASGLGGSNRRIRSCRSNPVWPPSARPWMSRASVFHFPART